MTHDDFLARVKKVSINLYNELIEHKAVSDRDVATLLYTYAINLAENIDGLKRVYATPNPPLLVKRCAELASLAGLLAVRFSDYTDKAAHSEKQIDKWVNDLIESIEV